MKPAHPKELLIQLSRPTCTLEVEVSNAIDGISSQMREKNHTHCHVNFKCSHYIFCL